MWELLENVEKEETYGNTVSYLLKSDSKYFDIGYKVMKNQGKKGMLACGKAKYNGKIKLIYFLEDYKTVEKKINELDETGLLHLINNIGQELARLKTIGFLNLNCLDYRLDHIFVDDKTLQVHFIYLPLAIDANDVNTFETLLRVNLLAKLQNLNLLDAGQMDEVLARLTDSQNGDGDRVTEILLTGINCKESFSINVPEFIIGKKRDAVHGVIAGNGAVSRIHCKVTHKEGTFWLEDLNSSNGTYIDGKRLQTGERVVLRDGAEVKIADMRFQAQETRNK